MAICVLSSLLLTNVELDGRHWFGYSGHPTPYNSNDDVSLVNPKKKRAHGRAAKDSDADRETSDNFLEYLRMVGLMGYI